MGDGGIIVFLALTILGGVVLMMAAMSNRRKIREMEHRERLAMIERGVMPSPESNPAAFEAAVGFSEPPAPASGSGQRYRTAGVLLIGVGLGLMFLIGVAGNSEDLGLGIGGAWVSLGVACLINYWLLSRRHEEDRRVQWSPPKRRPEPPANMSP